MYIYSWVGPPLLPHPMSLYLGKSRVKKDDFKSKKNMGAGANNKSKQGLLHLKRAVKGGKVLDFSKKTPP